MKLQKTLLDCFNENLTIFEVHKVEASRQWNNIDIVAEINDEYLITIECKTNTDEQSNQRYRYREVVGQHRKDKKHQLFFIYL